MVINLFFYFFSFILLTSSLFTVFSQNSIYSVLFLVLSFVSSASLLFFLECEYISLIFIIIYVGAIAVLFLFVVMMLDVKTINMSKDFLKYFPFGSFIGTIFLVEILLSVSSLFEAFNPYNVSFLSNFYVDWFNVLYYFSAIAIIGHILYTDSLALADLTVVSQFAVDEQSVGEPAVQNEVVVVLEPVEAPRLVLEPLQLDDFLQPINPQSGELDGWPHVEDEDGLSLENFIEDENVQGFFWGDWHN